MPPPLCVCHWTALLYPGSLADSRAHRHWLEGGAGREGDEKGGNERRIMGGMRQNYNGNVERISLELNIISGDGISSQTNTV